MRAYIDRVARLRDAIEGLLEARTIEAQLGLYRAEVRPRLSGNGSSAWSGARASCPCSGSRGPSARWCTRAPAGSPASSATAWTT